MVEQFVGGGLDLVDSQGGEGFVGREELALFGEPHFRPRGIGGPEQGDQRRAERRGDVARAGVVGDQQLGACDDGLESAEREAVPPRANR